MQELSQKGPQDNDLTMNHKGHDMTLDHKLHENGIEMKSTFKHNLFNSSKRSGISRRGITPGPIEPLKLNQKRLGPTEKSYNIITNRQRKDHSPDAKFYGNSNILPQSKRDYQDYTKSEFSFDYTKLSIGKKFSTHRVIRKYLQYYENKKDKEIPPFVKELLENEEKLSQAVEDLYSLKTSFNNKEI